LHFVHELVVDVQSAGGVDDQNVTASVNGLAPGFFGQAFDRRCIGFDVGALINVRLDRLRNDLKLFASGGTVNIDRD
jgi:hypothetical protein